VPPTETPSTQVSLSSQIATPTSHVLLATALVHIKDVHGNWHACRALLDSASQFNFITSQFQTKLQTRKQGINISIQGINQVGTGLFTRGVLNFFLPQPIIHIATISSFQILKIIMTESTTALRAVSLTLKQKIFVNSKNLFLQLRRKV
jgi:hypothetical protein